MMICWIAYSVACEGNL